MMKRKSKIRTPYNAQNCNQSYENFKGKKEETTFHKQQKISPSQHRKQESRHVHKNLQKHIRRID